MWRSCSSQVSLPDHFARSEETATAIYGPALAVRGLGNLPLGGPNGRRASYRFLNTHTGTIESILLRYLMWDAKRKGYHGGTGGTVVVEVQSDDGTANHHPSGTTLASTSIAHPLQVGNFPTLKFVSPASLDSGNVYHLVFTNADPNPSENYASLNSLLLADPHRHTAEITMKQWAVLAAPPSAPSAWAIYPGNEMGLFLPIVQLNFGDGYASGTGYVDATVDVPVEIKNQVKVRKHLQSRLTTGRLGVCLYS